MKTILRQQILAKKNSNGRSTFDKNLEGTALFGILIGYRAFGTKTFKFAKKALKLDSKALAFNETKSSFLYPGALVVYIAIDAG